jgi:hypothetical protein
MDGKLYFFLTKAFYFFVITWKVKSFYFIAINEKCRETTAKDCVKI